MVRSEFERYHSQRSLRAPVSAWIPAVDYKKAIFIGEYFLLRIHSLIDFLLKLFEQCWYIIIDSNICWTNRFSHLFLIILSHKFFVTISLKLWLGFKESAVWEIVMMVICDLWPTFETRHSHKSQTPMSCSIESQPFATFSNSSSFRTICSNKFAGCFPASA